MPLDVPVMRTSSLTGPVTIARSPVDLVIFAAARLNR
jgi:hypothetical protein